MCSTEHINFFYVLKFAFYEVGLTIARTCFKATTSPAAAKKAMKLFRIETTTGVNLPSWRPATPISSKAITATRKEVLSFSFMLRNPTIKPRTKRTADKAGMTAKPATTANIIPMTKA